MKSVTTVWIFLLAGSVFGLQDLDGSSLLFARHPYLIHPQQKPDYRLVRRKEPSPPRGRPPSSSSQSPNPSRSGSQGRNGQDGPPRAPTPGIPSLPRDGPIPQMGTVNPYQAAQQMQLANDVTAAVQAHLPALEASRAALAERNARIAQTRSGQQHASEREGSPPPPLS